MLAVLARLLMAKLFWNRRGVLIGRLVWFPNAVRVILLGILRPTAAETRRAFLWRQFFREKRIF